MGVAVPGVDAAGTGSEALGTVPCDQDRLESACSGHSEHSEHSGHSDDSGREAARVLRRLARKGGEATEEDCFPLFDLLAPDGGGASRPAAAALPFVVGLATDPGMGARTELVGLLVVLHRAAAKAGPHQVDPEWPAAWQRHRPAMQALHADPDPAVRRAAISLVAGVPALAELCRAEAQPAVRVPLLLALGAVAAAVAAGSAAEAAPSARTEREAYEAYEATRAVLAAALEDTHPAVRVAAVHACALLDPLSPVRYAGLLVEAFSGATAPAAFEEAWYTPRGDEPWLREPVVAGTAGLFDDAPQAGTSFVAGLVDAARRTEDTALCSAALDVAWRLLVHRPSTGPALLPLAGELLAHPDGAVRLGAAHILAVLGPRAAPHADRLAALLDDPGEDEYIDGTVGEYARWALARIGDARALPGLVERLYQPYREGYSGGWIVGSPRRPDIDDVLVPLREHADALMPALLEAMRHDAAHYDGNGLLTRTFLRILKAWGEASLPALPDVVALLDDTRYSLDAAEALAAMGRAAASAEPALRRCAVLDAPANHCLVAWAAWRIGGDGPSPVRLLGDALNEEGPFHGPVHLLADFGRAAAPYAERVRRIMDHADAWSRVQAAGTLWALTGEPGPSVRALEEYVLQFADDHDDGYLTFGDALDVLTRIGTVTPAIRAALYTIKATDRRLSARPGYLAVLQDEGLRAAIEDVLTLTRSEP